MVLDLPLLPVSSEHLELSAGAVSRQFSGFWALVSPSVEQDGAEGAHVVSKALCLRRHSS